MRDVKHTLPVLTLVFLLLPLSLLGRDVQVVPDRMEDDLRPRQIFDGEDDRADVLPFGAQKVAQKGSMFSVVSVYGNNSLRYITRVTASGTTSDTNGVIQLSTGADATGRVMIRSRERARYIPGTHLISGVRVRGPPGSSLQSGQFYEFGPTDSQNGFGFGVDGDTGAYVFIEDGDDKQKIYRSNWNQDTLSSETPNPSGTTWSPDESAIYHVEYKWYGDGMIRWYIFAYDNDGNDRERILVHEMAFVGETSVEDPNQPITVRADNNGTGSNFDLYLGGLGFGAVPDVEAPERPVSEFISDYTITAPENEWVPLIALRKKSEYPPGSGRTNSARISFVTIKADIQNGPVLLRVTTSDTTSATFDPVTGWGEDSAVESSTNSGGFTVSEDSLPFLYEPVPAGTTGAAEGNRITSRERIVFGDDRTIVIWARSEDASDPEVTIVAKWEEQF